MQEPLRPKSLSNREENAATSNHFPSLPYRFGLCDLTLEVS